MKYQIINELKTWTEAESDCEAKDAKLATLLSTEEVEEVAKLIEDETYYWIGGRCKVVGQLGVLGEFEDKVREGEADQKT